MKSSKKKDIDILTGFVDLINSTGKIERKKSGLGIGRPQNSNMKLFEISTIALVLGWKPNSICSLIGYDLNVCGKSKRLSLEEMDRLFEFVTVRAQAGSFIYYPSLMDITIIDGNAHFYFFNWNGINAEGRGGDTMAYGLKELIDYCSNLINI
jgi:hypothetical protein